MKLKIIIMCSLLINSSSLPITYKLTNPAGAGFFSTFNTVLGALDSYENSNTCDGLIVDFEDQGFYYDYTHGPNWWSYYFEPIYLNVQDNNRTKFPRYKKITFTFAAQFEMSRIQSNELIQKYIHLKPHLQKKLDTFVQEHFNNHVIGVHYRGTDKAIEAPTVSYETVSNYLHQEIIQDDTLNIFVATDDENFLIFIQQQFPGRIIALNAIRSQNGQPVHSAYYENNYQKGEDAILDCLLLSKCSKLYKTASNLSDCSAMFNPSIPVVNLNKSYFECTITSCYDVFLVFNTVLSLLNRYENNTLDGLHINFSTEGNYYNDQEGSNWWEFHFKPLCVGKNSTPLKLPNYALEILCLTSLFEMPATRAHELITKYIELKPTILEKANNFIKQQFGNNYILGVYFDRTISQEELFSELDKQIQLIPANYTILLVSDDVSFFNEMQKKYSNLISMHNPNNKENVSRAHKEEQTLVECILLSKSNSVIGASSSILKMTRQFNPTLSVVEFGKTWIEAI